MSMEVGDRGRVGSDGRTSPVRWFLEQIFMGMVALRVELLHWSSRISLSVSFRCISSVYVS